jgi:uncharacterized integral membrane protein
MRVVHWVAALVAAALAIPFAVSNREPVSLGFWPLPFVVDLPLYLLVLVLLLVGFAVGAVVTWIAGGRVRRESRRRRQRVEALERQLAAARSRLEEQSGKEKSGVPA